MIIYRHLALICVKCLFSSVVSLQMQDKERQQAQIGIVVEFAIALIGKLDGINRHSFNSFRLRVGE